MLFDSRKCLHNNGVYSQLCDGCNITTGNKPVVDCVFHFARPTFKTYTDEQLYDVLSTDFRTFGKDGGVTFSGGEPLLQAESLTPLLERLCTSNINICFETSLVVPIKNIKDTMPYISELIVDLKLQPEMKLRSKEYFCHIKDVVNLICSDIDITYRFVFVDSISDCKDEVVNKLKALGIDSIELLKAHNLGATKYRKLCLENVDYSANEDRFRAFGAFLENNGIKTTFLAI